jgi:hypothetical protein
MFKTFLLSFAVLFFVCLLGCGLSKTKDSRVKEFEGVITYSVSSTTYKYDTTRLVDSTCYYDTMKCYYSHGNTLKIESGNNPGKINKVIYLPAEGKQFLGFTNVDSLSWFDVTEHTNIGEKQLISSKTNEHILSRNCEKFTVKTMFNVSSFYCFVVDDYFFSKGYLPIDDQHFTNCNYNGYNAYTSQAGSLFLSHQYAVYSAPMDKIEYKLLFKAISVEERELDPEIFRIDRSKLKKIPQPF